MRSSPVIVAILMVIGLSLTPSLCHGGYGAKSGGQWKW